jgi:translation initiation factor 6
MGSIKYQIRGSDYVGAFASVNDTHCFLVRDATEAAKRVISEALEVDIVPVSVGGSGFVGILSRANSNGVLLANIATDDELAAFRSRSGSINVGVLESSLNAIGNNILANDKIAIVNPDYSRDDMKNIEDVLGVEVVREALGGFKTVGAGNLLTNKGLVVNNRSTDEEKEAAEKVTGFESVRTTANTGSLSIGVSALVNSKGMVVGNSTTGYELTRIMEALEIN